MKNYFIPFLFLVSLSAFAGFGGGFSSGRSSFGGFRSSGTSRSYSAPRPAAPAYRAPSYSARPHSAAPSTHTTVIHSGGGMGGSGFMSGMFMGSMLNRPAVVVAPGVVAAQGDYAVQAPVIAQQGWGFFSWLFAIVLLGGALWVLYAVLRAVLA